jgi:hypothetical protein
LKSSCTVPHKRPGRNRTGPVSIALLSAAYLYVVFQRVPVHTFQVQQAYAITHIFLNSKIFLKEKAVEATKQKKEERRKNLSPRNRKACHSTSTALLKISRPSYFIQYFIQFTQGHVLPNIYVCLQFFQKTPTGGAWGSISAGL